MDSIEYIENVMSKTKSKVKLLDNDGKMVLIYKKGDAYIIWDLRIVNEFTSMNIPVGEPTEVKLFAMHTLLSKNTTVEKIGNYVYAFKHKDRYVIIRKMIREKSTVYIRNKNAKVRLI